MKRSHDVLLALAYVSRISDPDSLRSRFFESLNGREDAVTFAFSDRLPTGIPEHRVLPIATLRSSFGYAVMAESPACGEEERAVFRNAFQFLAVLLENLLQARDLKRKNDFFRKQAEETLAANDALLRIAGDTAKFGGWSVDLSSNVCTWSEKTADIHEVPRGYAPPVQDGLNFYAPEWRERITRVFTDCAEKGIAYDEEMEIVTRKGKRAWVRTTGEAVRNDKGEIAKVQGSFQEITERKQAEAAIRKSEENYRLLVENQTDMVVKIDLEGRFLFASPSYCMTFGKTEAELLGQTFMPLIHEEDRALTAKAMEDLHRPPHTAYVEQRALTQEGWAWLAWVDTAVLDDQGHVKEIICVGRNITEHKRVEESLNRIEWMLSKNPPSGTDSASESHDQGYGDLTELNRNGTVHQSIGREMLASIAEEYMDLLGTSSAIYESNGDYAFEIFASGWCRMMDRASRELCNTPDNARALDSGRWLCHESCWTSCSKEAIRTGLPMDIECSGGIRLYSVPIAAGGEIVGAINFGYGDPPRDPEKLRQLADAFHLRYDDLAREANVYESRPYYIVEMAKKRLNTSARLIGSIIEAKRAEGERENLQAQLVQAQKMESVGRLAGGVAHDYNNMLSVIIGFTELAMAKAAPDNPVYADLKEILDAAQRSADITRQLLAFARQQTIAPRVLELNETVEAMLKMLRRLIGEDIDLSWRPGAGRMPVFMDPSQLDQILANLCVNARDAIGGVGAITIETDKVSFDGAYCADHAGAVPGDFFQLTVSDDGHGMDKETLGHLFEPFFTTKGLGQGTGLGLATVYGIVSQNDGFCNVYSEPGKGTTFKIYLPLHAGIDAGTITQEAPSILPGQGETVLIVEDEAPVLKLARRMLEGLNYTVLTAATSRDALVLAEEHLSASEDAQPGAGNIHLLITDVVMPEMNGRDLAERLQARDPDLKVLFMSGYTADVIAKQGVLEAGVHFVQKPFSRQELAARVRRALEG